MKKILLHLSNENEYRSFVRALVKNCSDQFQIIGNSVHGTLFDTHHKLKPDIVILPTNEYTQEFHDYITEYHKTVKIILFTNNLVVNIQIINFWNNMNISILSKTEHYPELKPTNWIQCNDLYDDNIYYNLNKARNNKIAVMLSTDDEKNRNALEKVLYPNSTNKLVLFNSTTFKHPQNVGLLTPEDLCKVLNVFHKLIDLDNKFSAEASVCGIDSISIDGEILDNIVNNKLQSQTSLKYKSYSNFILQSFLPIL